MSVFEAMMLLTGQSSASMAPYIFIVCSEATATTHTATRPSSAAVLATALIRSILVCATAGFCCGWSRRTLLWDGEMLRDRIQIENLADEVSKRDHEVGSVSRSSRRKFNRSLRGQLHLLLGAQKNHVG